MHSSAISISWSGSPIILCWHWGGEECTNDFMSPGMTYSIICWNMNTVWDQCYDLSALWHGICFVIASRPVLGCALWGYKQNIYDAAAMQSALVKRNCLTTCLFTLLSTHSGVQIRTSGFECWKMIRGSVRSCWDTLTRYSLNRDFEAPSVWPSQRWRNGTIHWKQSFT